MYRLTKGTMTERLIHMSCIEPMCEGDHAMVRQELLLKTKATCGGGSSWHGNTAWPEVP